MQNVRNNLGIRTHLKIEKRVIAKIGHVLRMPDEKPTKIAVLGWIEKLEKWEKTPCKKKKTVIYCKKLLREAKIDWIEAGRMAQDRSARKEGSS